MPTATQSMAATRQPVSTVTGLRWGLYVGSPQSGEPLLVMKQRAPAPVGQSANQPAAVPQKLAAISDSTCIGLPQDSMLLCRLVCVCVDIVVVVVVHFFVVSVVSVVVVVVVDIVMDFLYDTVRSPRHYCCCC